jgi:Fe-S-cluster containining protein
MCCRGIALLFTKKDIKERWQDTVNRDFVLAHWHRISKAQALKNNPHLASIMDEYERDTRTIYWYTCDMLVENRCLIHQERPNICRGYPWYGKNPADCQAEFLYGENCGYKIDQLLGRG